MLSPALKRHPLPCSIMQTQTLRLLLPPPPPPGQATLRRTDHSTQHQILFPLKPYHFPVIRKPSMNPNTVTTPLFATQAPTSSSPSSSSKDEDNKEVPKNAILFDLLPSYTILLYVMMDFIRHPNSLSCAADVLFVLSQIFRNHVKSYDKRTKSRSKSTVAVVAVLIWRVLLVLWPLFKMFESQDIFFRLFYLAFLVFGLGVAALDVAVDRSTQEQR